MNKLLGEEPTKKQLISACASYDHRYIIMDDREKATIERECKEWWRSIIREINYPSNHPMIRELAEKRGAAERKRKSDASDQ